MCKALEAIVRDVIVDYMQANDMLADCQHGYCSKRSCNTQLLEVVHDITLAIGNNQPIDIIFLGFRKAFDSVPHQQLITRLNMRGISGTILNWIRNFLPERQQKVKVGNIFSKTTDVTSGVHQGSILGPIVFIIYINDLPDCVSCTCIVFADDTKLYHFSSKSSVLQKDLTSLERLSDLWHLQFKIKKMQGSSLWCK